MSTDTKNGRTNFQTSAEASALKGYFLKLTPGETIPDETVNRIIGGDWRERSYIVQTAIKQTFNESKIAIARVRKVGFKRLMDGEAVEAGEDYIARTRNMVKRGIRMVSAANDEGLTGEQKTRRNVLQACFGTVAFLMGKPQQTKMLAMAEQKPLEIGDTLKLFGGK